MARVYRTIMILILTLLVSPGCLLSVEKLKVATSVRNSPSYYLPMMAAEEKGFWSQQGLAVDWLQFTGGAPLTSGVAAGHVPMGIDTVINVMSRMAPVVSVILLAETGPRLDWYFWVRPDNPLKEPAQLKGLKIGVTRLGGAPHAYGRAVIKSLGLEGEVKFLATGDIRASHAGLKTGAIEAVVQPLLTMVALKVAGQAREFININQYLPKEWTENAVFGRKDFVARDPEKTRKVVTAMLRAIAFIKANPAWALEKMKEVSGLSDQAANLAASSIYFTATGRIEKKALENIRGFILDYGLAPKDKVPPVEEFYTNKFID